jgi:GR25 family glycosyltransferase involved in LPS biosynthesis
MKNKSYLFLVVGLCLLIILWATACTTKDRFVLLKGTKEIPMYCINLSSETTRRKHIQDVFGPYVEMVDAVDTRNDAWKQYSHYLTEEGVKQMKRSERTKKRYNHYELTPGAVGCFLSHIKCWNKFLDTYPSDGDFVFILEDDTMPAPTFTQTFSKIVGDFPPRCDILLCSHIAFGEMERFTHNEKDYRRMRPISAFYLLNAYFITARGIKKILGDLDQKDNKFYKQLDSYLSDLVNQEKLEVCLLQEIECMQVGLSPTSIQTFAMV